MKNGKRFGFGVLFALTLLYLTSCSKTDLPDWDTYTSKEHLYQIQYPIDWKIALNGHAFTVTPPDGTGLVSVTGYVDPKPVFDEAAFKTMVMLDFVECRVKEPFKPVKGQNWVGEDAVYERTVNGQRIIYLFRIAHQGQVGVFVAISEIEAHLERCMPNYKQIMDSLVLLTPPPEEYIGKYGVQDQNGTTAKKRHWQDILIDWIRATEPVDRDKTQSY